MSVPSSAADRIEAESLGLGSYHSHPCRGRHFLPRDSHTHPRIFWEACTERSTGARLRSTRGVVLQGTFDSGRRKCRGDVKASVHLESPSFPLAGVQISSPRLAYCVCTPHTRITKSSVGLNILPPPLLSGPLAHRTTPFSCPSWGQIQALHYHLSFPKHWQRNRTLAPVGAGALA